MTVQYVVSAGGVVPMRDVGKQHGANLRNLLCILTLQQGIVFRGRTQAAFTSQFGHVSEQSAALTQKKTRSRGCRPARNSFFPSAQLLSWQLAVVRPKKKLSMWMRRFRPSQSTQANTSNTWGRADGALGALPALFLSASNLPSPVKIGGAA